MGRCNAAPGGRPMRSSLLGATNRPAQDALTHLPGFGAWDSRVPRGHSSRDGKERPERTGRLSGSPTSQFAGLAPRCSPLSHGTVSRGSSSRRAERACHQISSSAVSNDVHPEAAPCGNPVGSSRFLLSCPACKSLEAAGRPRAEPGPLLSKPAEQGKDRPAPPSQGGDACEEPTESDSNPGFVGQRCARRTLPSHDQVLFPGSFGGSNKSGR
jgi:hypothetical protein